MSWPESPTTFRTAISFPSELGLPYHWQKQWLLHSHSGKTIERTGTGSAEGALVVPEAASHSSHKPERALLCFVDWYSGLEKFGNVSKALKLKVSTENYAQLTCSVCSDSQSLTAWVGLPSVGSCLSGKRKHLLDLRNVPSHWRPGESCDKSLRQRRQDGTRRRDEYESVLSICTVAENQLGERQEEGRPSCCPGTI